MRKFPLSHLSVSVVYTIWLILGNLVSTSNSSETYDFIIVGGGTGGSVMARRLSEDRRFTVLVIEAGPLPKEGHEIPANAPNFLGDNDVTFHYQSTPQQNSAMRSEGIVNIVSGKMLGGTSSLNWMFFNRGSPYDYDNWANITGDYSWSYSNMLNYFRRIESYDGEFHSDQHGYSGPITVSRDRYAPGLSTWLSAGSSLGYPTLDPNGPQKISFAPVEFSKKRGRRVSGYIGYLKPILDSNSNLHIRLNTSATRIMFEGKKAVGVATKKNSETEEVTFYASKEIIVCAGAYGSPVLLQASGVGPAEVLKAAKISVVHDLPVGQNYHDHVAMPLNVVVNDSSQVTIPSRDFTPESLAYFNAFGDGPYSIAGGATGQGFMASSVAIAEGYRDWADVHYTMAHSTEPYLFADFNPRNASVSSSELVIQIVLFLTRPKSRGSIKLNPKGVNEMPLIDVNFMADSRDIQAMVDAMREGIQAVEKTPAYQRLAARFIPIDYANCPEYEPDSSDPAEYFRCYVRHATVSGCHAGGTNRMGRADDPDAVVDPQLRVIGIEGLRVVDTSVMPSIPNANTHVPVYGVAEKASELILQRWTQVQPIYTYNYPVASYPASSYPASSYPVTSYPVSSYPVSSLTPQQSTRSINTYYGYGVPTGTVYNQRTGGYYV